MRLLVVSTFYDTHRGGLEIVAGELARQLAARGVEVRWLAANDAAPPGDLATAPVKAWNLTERKLGIPYPVFGLHAFAAIRREAAWADAVLVHDSLYISSVFALIAARLAGKPLLVVQHIGAVPYTNPLLRGLMALANAVVARPVLAAADQVVFISETTRRFFDRVRFRRLPELLLNGVDAATFRPAVDAAERAALKRRLGLPEDRPVALFVGRFVEKKGLKLLREAAARRPDLAWVFAGWGVLDPGGWGLPQTQVHRDLSGAGLAELYRAADVFVIPSVGEGFPLVVQEALASGLPVVCGAETVEADPQAAPWLEGVDPEAPDALDRFDAAMTRALARPAGEASERAAFARRRYSWPAAADRYRALLDGLVASGRPQPAPAETPLERAA